MRRVWKKIERETGNSEQLTVKWWHGARGKGHGVIREYPSNRCYLCSINKGSEIQRFKGTKASGIEQRA
jgi:hypothetical protein